MCSAHRGLQRAGFETSEEWTDRKQEQAPGLRAVLPSSPRETLLQKSFGVCAAFPCERIRELEEGFVRKILGEVAGMKANRGGRFQLSRSPQSSGSENLSCLASSN